MKFLLLSQVWKQAALLQVHQYISTSFGQKRPTDIKNNRRFIETISMDECKEDLKNTFARLEQVLTTNPGDSNVLQGILKFCDRAQKYPISRLSTALHNFGVPQSSSLKITATAVLKRAKKGKIFVQPGAVKRRRSEGKSKNSVQKGMQVKKNPFNVEPSKNRPHKFSQNVKKGEAVSKKAGRSMSSKTKHLSKRKVKNSDGDGKYYGTT